MLRYDKDTNEKSLIIDNVDTSHLALIQKAFQEDNLTEPNTEDNIYIETIPIDYLYKDDFDLDGWDFDESLNKNINY
jgi:hypothetical protein